MFLKKGIVQTRIMHFFLQVTLKLLKWPWIKIMTLPQMISNLHVKKELLMFLHKKDIDTNYAIFFFIQVTLDLLKWPRVKIITHPQEIYNFVWSRNFLCYSKRKIWTNSNYALFFTVTLNLPKRPVV